MDQEQNKKIEELAYKVLQLSRNTLLVNLRFMDLALSQFTYKTMQESTLMTDGQFFLYHPPHVLRSYRSEQTVPTRDFLHMVMHCILGHMYMSPALNHIYWDLACDIAVENIISDLGLPCVDAVRAKGQREYTEAIRKELNLVTAETIYDYLVKNKPSEMRMADLRGLFFADNHEIWYMTADEKYQKYGIGEPPKKDDPEQQNMAEGSGGEKETSAPNDNYQDGLASRMKPGEVKQIWKNIAERMKVDLSSFSKLPGILGGYLQQNIGDLTREKYDYTEFLKKFAVMGEVMQVSDDEFDNIYYTYGLQLYEHVPLIEPLEYKEVKRIREFAIVIDTSGSTSGELVQRFVQKTYNILKSTESFFTKINLHIIQCDAEVQEDVKITTQEEFDRYIKEMVIHGLGGTDFRPAFTYVDELIKKKEFTNLKGLIYFTDGWGKFPQQKPNYETAFVYVQDDYNCEEVPPWAIRLVLKKKEI